MKKFKCKKEVLAEPMLRGAYNNMRGWITPEGENPNDEGYLVQYIGSEPNVEGYAHYVSWSPKGVFEEGYDSVDSFKDRLELESTELNERLFKLTEFIQSPAAFPNLEEHEQMLLRQQQQYMYNYLSVLQTRQGYSMSTNPIPRHKVAYPTVQAMLSLVEYQFNILEGTTTTTCHAVIRGNGQTFTIGYGESGCVNPDDFNQALGEKYAKERAEADAVNNIWKCIGFAVAMGYTNG